MTGRRFRLKAETTELLGEVRKPRVQRLKQALHAQRVAGSHAAGALMAFDRGASPLWSASKEGSMFESISRRGFLGLLATVALAEVGAPVVPFAFQTQSAAPPAVAAVPGAFPAQDPDLVKEMVGVSHGNLPRVKELVSARPALARASWDWGYGDWETAIDAASHVGNRPIADYLIANGAPPTIYTAAMMGQLAIVKM